LLSFAQPASALHLFVLPLLPAFVCIPAAVYSGKTNQGLVEFAASFGLLTLMHQVGINPTSAASSGPAFEQIMIRIVGSLVVALIAKSNVRSFLIFSMRLHGSSRRTSLKRCIAPIILAIVEVRPPELNL